VTKLVPYRTRPPAANGSGSRTVAVNVTIPIVYSSGRPYSVARCKISVELVAPVRADDQTCWQFEGEVGDTNFWRGITLKVPRALFAETDEIQLTIAPIILGARPPL
jgi:hypothetical protein